MNFLAVDTSGKRLSVVACKNGKKFVSTAEDCFHAHSVRLMEEIDGALKAAELTLSDCDYFAAVVGAGSFTGIRIGISTVKGLCLACGKPALSVTSFDTLAYAERSGKTLALFDAGRGFYYACGYGENREELVAPAYRSRGEVEELIKQGFAAVAAEELDIPAKLVDPAEGLFYACLQKGGRRTGAEKLAALYLRRSSAEENAK